MRHNMPKYAESKPSVPVSSTDAGAVKLMRFYTTKTIKNKDGTTTEKDISFLNVKIGKKTYLVNDKKLETLLITRIYEYILLPEEMDMFVC